MLDKEFRYYLDNQSKLVDQYHNKYIVIKGCEVVGSYKSREEALESAKERFELGTFLIQYCTLGEESYSHTFHSRVVFN